MTDELRCQVCGSVNQPDDEFCGNCGAYLAWADDAEAAETAAEASIDRAIEAPGNQADAADAPAPSAGPPAAPAARSSDEIAVAPITRTAAVTCSKCGRSNPPNRTFCQRCGNRLTASTGSKGESRS